MFEQQCVQWCLLLKWGDRNDMSRTKLGKTIINTGGVDKYAIGYVSQ